uniref:Uncharacterized protein n=1 Tax=Rhizophora mucronata TaxID=61149 RepID=A0A2P2N5G5_RHIMU
MTMLDSDTQIEEQRQSFPIKVYYFNSFP